MADLAKAELRELSPDGKSEINPDKNCQVQFNPETLKVSFANQISKPESSGTTKGKPAKQFVGPGTTKLNLQLWFDVTAPMPPGQQAEQDVRKLTKKVAYFITPKPGDSAEKKIPPVVRFSWGSFQFDGIMESLEETLEFFSSDGRPLRASVAINLTQQEITEIQVGATNIPNVQTPGTRPLTQAPAGSSVQGLADSQGKGDNWQDIAAANGIENPRMLQPGQLLDMNASAGISIGGSVGLSIGAGVSTQTGVGIQTDLSLSGGASIGG
ncbi:MAG TPA: LysM peptidoglycan-binding domain-containing protein [Pyrinomonadaceae bacterium]|nr:LysM peptidoglycan-binding domain-containing protein [Pyrinomonadaceae bacterium]